MEDQSQNVSNLNDLYPCCLQGFFEKKGLNLMITSQRLGVMSFVLLGASGVTSFYTSFNIVADFIGLAGLLILFSSLFWSMFEFEQKHHAPIGRVRFAQDYFELEEQGLRFKWKEVCDLKMGQVRGEELHFRPRKFGPRYSAGQDTFLEIRSGSQEIMLFLRLDKNKDQKVFNEIIRAQYAKGYLPLHAVRRGLNLQYAEVQELKKLLDRNDA